MTGFDIVEVSRLLRCKQLFLTLPFKPSHPLSAKLVLQYLSENKSKCLDRNAELLFHLHFLLLVFLITQLLLCILKFSLIIRQQNCDLVADSSSLGRYLLLLQVWTCFKLPLRLCSFLLNRSFNGFLRLNPLKLISVGAAANGSCCNYCGK